MFGLIADVENMFDFVADEDLREILGSRFSCHTKGPTEVDIMNIRELIFFLNNANLVITSADKGNKTVIMNKSEYRTR